MGIVNKRLHKLFVLNYAILTLCVLCSALLLGLFVYRLTHDELFYAALNALAAFVLVGVATITYARSLPKLRQLRDTEIEAHRLTQRLYRLRDLR